jgi:tight adherence protein C
MGLEMAWNMVSNEIRDVGPTLADEMALVNLEVHLGAPRVEAMRHMADRTDAQEVVSLTTMIVQTERFGTSIADALLTTAATLREERSLKAQEVAERMPVKLLLPMTLFIFPALLVVLVGPAAIRLWHIINST